VYTRFLLQHLSQPGRLLRRMWAAVADGGVLIVEDADFDGWCCDPPNEGFELFLDAYRQVLARRGGDHAMGRKLYSCVGGTGRARRDHGRAGQPAPVHRRSAHAHRRPASLPALVPARA
jgi:hypothetical protein